MSQRVYNFSAGPAMLPLAVLERAQKELLSHGDSGQSVMEMSHRSSEYEAIHFKVEKDLRELLNIPENYTVLFLQGGASLQFHMIPLNILKQGEKAAVIVTGNWAKKALAGIKEVGLVDVLASSEDKNFSYVPKVADKDVSAYKYVHYVSNNTIYGTRETSIPPINHPLIVSDMSSDILSREIDVSKHGIIFAGAQKNMGIAGLTVVIIRNDLLDLVDPSTPEFLKFSTHAKAQSLFNTAPTYAIYMAGLVLEWIKDLGGLKAMEALNKAKADRLYNYLDASNFYETTAAKEDRSWMNVTFKTSSEDLDKALVKKCDAAGLVNTKGYRTVGGLRCSIYNAMPMEGIEALIEVLEQFKKENA